LRPSTQDKLNIGRSVASGVIDFFWNWQQIFEHFQKSLVIKREKRSRNLFENACWPL
jgi:hypothetical protein